MSLAVAMSEFDLYTCGAPLLPPNHPLIHTVMLRGNLTCASPIELPFYGTSADVGRKDLCAHCGIEGGEIDNELKKCFKTVLPICVQCKAMGLDCIVQRPYGKR